LSPLSAAVFQESPLAINPGGALDQPHRRGPNPPAVDLGDEDPLYTRTLSKGPPDRRRVSLRWLCGSLLTGLFSAALVGGALQAAIGIDESFIVRPAFARSAVGVDQPATAVKGDRFRPAPEPEVSRRVIQISTVSRVDDRDIVRVRPFAHVLTNLAADVAPEVAAKVPSFNPLDIFSDTGETPVELAASDAIYGAEVDGEISIKTSDFPVQGGSYGAVDEVALADVEMMVRGSAPALAATMTEVASLPYVDPARFEMSSSETTALAASLAVAITPENVSLLEKSEGLDEPAVVDKLVVVAAGSSLRKMIIDQGASEDEATEIVSAFRANFDFDFVGGQTLRFGLVSDEPGVMRPVRVSIYDEDRHIATVGLSDNGVFGPVSEPQIDVDLQKEPEAAPEAAPHPAGALPTIYAGLWSTGLSLDMPTELIDSIVRIFAYDVDYQSRLSPSDTLEVVYSADGDAKSAEILYAAITLGSATHRFYRFRNPEDGSVDYYDESGKSAQKFLMRKPVGQGRFSSSFGMRKHPIYRRLRMHSGIDWAAPAGTPIMAAGNGVVEKIGTRSGYGRSIVLRHANGYETTYNHMSRYARGLEPGMRVRQGQVIGYVGSTGLSTGPHLHFEVLVNDRFVDPMKIKLPRGRELQGRDLAAFEQDRRRIDERLDREDSHFASAN
jgi:murein DD-endopeptidase MepM/ murein hydrolase activator NlpD